ncbi:MAG: hypothetical protein JWO30_5014 [Fibrobacteres bacterium]|nr:hypothetical protein [Fibrobacterota bacterium]
MNKPILRKVMALAMLLLGSSLDDCFAEDADPDSEQDCIECGHLGLPIIHPSDRFVGMTPPVHGPAARLAPNPEVAEHSVPPCRHSLQLGPISMGPGGIARGGWMDANGIPCIPMVLGLPRSQGPPVEARLVSGRSSPGILLFRRLPSLRAERLSPDRNRPLLNALTAGAFVRDGGLCHPVFPLLST